METKNQRVNETINTIVNAVDITIHTITKTELKRHVTVNEYTDKQHVFYSLTIATKRNNAKNTLLDLDIFALIGVRGGVKTWHIREIASGLREGKGLEKLSQWVRILTI